MEFSDPFGTVLNFVDERSYYDYLLQSYADLVNEDVWLAERKKKLVSAIDTAAGLVQKTKGTVKLGGVKFTGSIVRKENISLRFPGNAWFKSIETKKPVIIK